VLFSLELDPTLYEAVLYTVCTFWGWTLWTVLSKVVLFSPEVVLFFPEINVLPKAKSSFLSYNSFAEATKLLSGSTNILSGSRIILPESCIILSEATALFPEMYLIFPELQKCLRKHKLFSCGCTTLS
jgi:hypothetical protein